MVGVMDSRKAHEKVGWKEIELVLMMGASMVLAMVVPRVYLLEKWSDALAVAATVDGKAGLKVAKQAALMAFSEVALTVDYSEIQ